MKCKSIMLQFQKAVNDMRQIRNGVLLNGFAIACIISDHFIFFDFLGVNYAIDQNNPKQYYYFHHKWS